MGLPRFRSPEVVGNAFRVCSPGILLGCDHHGRAIPSIEEDPRGRAFRVRLLGPVDPPGGPGALEIGKVGIVLTFLRVTQHFRQHEFVIGPGVPVAALGLLEDFDAGETTSLAFRFGRVKPVAHPPFGGKSDGGIEKRARAGVLQVPAGKSFGFLFDEAAGRIVAAPVIEVGEEIPQIDALDDEGMLGTGGGGMGAEDSCHVRVPAALQRDRNARGGGEVDFESGGINRFGGIKVDPLSLVLGVECDVGSPHHGPLFEQTALSRRSDLVMPEQVDRDAADWFFPGVETGLLDHGTIGFPSLGAPGHRHSRERISARGLFPVREDGSDWPLVGAVEPVVVLANQSPRWGNHHLEFRDSVRPGPRLDGAECGADLAVLISGGPDHALGIPVELADGL